MRASEIKARGAWQGEPEDYVTLDQDARHRRRIAMTGEGGVSFLLDLPHAVHLKDGDGIVLEDGRIVEVRAVPEDLLEVRGADRNHLLRLAWHLGNRHLAAQIEDNRILIRRDHVIADMLRGLSATVREVVEPFTPEAGAYDHGHDHG